MNGLEIYYEVYGDLDAGETPLLVLHGSFMSAEAMAPLSEGFAVKLFKMRGGGDKKAAAKGFTEEFNPALKYGAIITFLL